ncbi:tyrosine-protein phosphatase RLPH2-like [Zingiber officinale]|uniref:tyrosine-protein phosphatase RLPH2-like n=1 Tax=Zingiber officinale TaxID=94328 RepID=UPI001C4ADAB7|nr:tyrosine-protein phosphatase RLPH2-like [Zingiber officinale]
MTTLEVIYGHPRKDVHTISFLLGIDLLLFLPSRCPLQRHVFLCCNHHLACVGALPKASPFPPPGGVREERWFEGEGYEAKHVQGRRWDGDTGVRFCTDAGPTFESYGVARGSAGKSLMLTKSSFQNWFRVHEAILRL